MNRLAPLLGFVLLAAPAATAQTPDTTAAWRYLPLHPGNVWEYEHWSVECIYPTVCNTIFHGYTQWRVVGDSAVGGRTYAVIRQSALGPSGGVPTVTGHALVRFDTTAAHGVVRSADGTEAYWPDIFALRCRLDLPFEVMTTCGEWGPPVRAVRGTFPIWHNGVLTGLPTKDLSTMAESVAFVPDLGMVAHSAGKFSYSWRSLRYAHVGGVSYGYVAVPAEGEPLPPALALSVAPNPVRERATLRLTLPEAGAVRVDVYDALGRRVHAVDLGARPAGESRLRLDAGRWAPGLYVVRATAAGGQTATTRLVRAD